MSPKSGRDPKNLELDKAAARALIQAAVDVELFTIPLYMTTLYSISGTYPAPTAGPDVWPGLRPTPTAATFNQLAYNVIFSVYVQEMLHLQLAGNLASAMGIPPKMNAPTYDGTNLPCIGSLKKMPGYEDVVVRLGPLDQNQVRLFLAIESPDWKSSTPKPAVPFKGWQPKRDLPTFGTIGHLYECLQEYLDLTYAGPHGTTTLWENLYSPGSVQIDLFNYESTKDSHPGPEYPTFDVFFPKDATPQEARPMADTMIAAITEQGEGRDAAHGTVPVEDKYVPSESAMIADFEAADVRHLWDQLGHYERFQQVLFWLRETENWPQWWEARGAKGWTWEDLVLDPTNVTAATQKFAQQRADALNSPATAEQINDALDQSYTSLLAAIEASWINSAWLERQDGSTAIDAKELFPFAAMQALYTRVAAVWAANGVPRFKFVPVSGDKLQPYPHQPAAHACQGLDPWNPGLNDCANAVIHTCSQANSCTNQGGCGYPDPPNGFPGVNTDQGGGGGCGAPIPVAQVLNGKEGTVWQAPIPDGKPIPLHAGSAVWESAWTLFQAIYPQAGKATPPAPNNLRLVLPPS